MSRNWVARLLLFLDRSDGQSMVIVVILLPVLLGIAGLGVSLGSVYLEQSRLQNAVDAAALAGAQTESAGGSASAEVSVLTLDDPGASGTVEVNKNNSMQVLADGDKVVSGGLAAVFGFRTFTVKAHATAQFGAGSAFGYAIFQGSTKSTDTLQMTDGGNKIFGAVHSNSNISFGGGITINGPVTASGNINGSINGGPETAQSPIVPMPTFVVPSLASPPPNPPSATVYPTNASWNGTLQGPLIVNGRQSVVGGTINGDLIINSSTSQQINGNLTVNGDVFLESPTSVNATLTINGSLIVTSPPTFNGSLHVTGTTYAENVSLPAAGGSTFSGNIYVQNGSLNFGNGADTVNGNVLVINTTSSPVTASLGGGSTYNGYVIVQGGSITTNGGITVNNGSYLTLAALPNSGGVGGNITFVGGGNPLYGILYAPDGTIDYGSGSGIGIDGSVIANTVIVGGGLGVTYDATAFQSSPFHPQSVISLVN